MDFTVFGTGKRNRSPRSSVGSNNSDNIFLADAEAWTAGDHDLFPIGLAAATNNSSNPDLTTFFGVADMESYEEPPPAPAPEPAQPEDTFAQVEDVSEASDLFRQVPVTQPSGMGFSFAGADDDSAASTGVFGINVGMNSMSLASSAHSVASSVSGISTDTNMSYSQPTFSAPNCTCQVCLLPDPANKNRRHCTKGHRFHWLRLCANHPMASMCTHVNKCVSCRANRGFCVLESAGMPLPSAPRAPVPAIHEAVLDGKGTSWVERSKEIRLESKRTGNGAKRPYQTNVIRLRWPDEPLASTADVVVCIDSELFLVKQVWSNGRLQPPLQLESAEPNCLHLRLTLNPADFRALQPSPLDATRERPKGIGWASILFSTADGARLWLWADLAVVSDKFDKTEVQKRLPAGVKSMSQIKERAKASLAKRGRIALQGAQP